MKNNYDPEEICYLCGTQLGIMPVNFDHIFQQQFIVRDQPKARGFDYGGVMPVHVACNEKFGTGTQAPESICGKALRLLEVLHREHALAERRDDPNFRVALINSSCFPDFTEQDVKYFKLIDVTNVQYNDWAHGNYLLDKQMINPFQIPNDIALSTLAKSTAGFLVKRYNFSRSDKWRILALSFYAQDDNFDLDDLFGNVRPLEVGIKLWIKSENNVWFTGYKHSRYLVFFCIESVPSNIFQQFKDQLNTVFQDAGCLFFESDKLIDLVGYNWSKNEY